MNYSVVPGLFADVAVRSTVVLLGAFLVTARMRRRSAAMRHLVWGVAAAVVLALPLGRAILPAYEVPVLARGVGGVRGEAPEVGVRPAAPVAEDRLPKERAGGAVVSGHRRTLDVSTAMLVIWGAGAACVSSYWVIGWVAVRRMCRSVPVVREGRVWEAMTNAGRELGLRRGVELRVGCRVRMPITCGTVRPRLMLPVEAEGWSGDRLRATMMHELAHVRRMDCAAQWVMNWACAAYWFNPLVWLAAVRLRVERELACDDLVLNHGAGAVGYAEHLLAVARAFRGESFWRAGAIAMARPSGLRRRVAGILDGGVNRRVVSGRWVVTVVGVAGVMVVPLACVRVGGRQSGGAATRPVVMPASRPVDLGGGSQAVATMVEYPSCVTVLDDETGKPVEGVEIVYDGGEAAARFVNDGQGHTRVFYDNRGRERHILTDARGQARFTFRGGTVGDTGMTLARTGYIGKLINWHPTGGGPPAEYTVRLEPASSIGGKVVDGAGRPIGGANVEIYVNGSSTDDGQLFIEAPWINRAVKTEADGTWHFDRVPLHAESVKVAAWDYGHLDGQYFFLREYSPQSALRDRTSVLTLPVGVALRGKVVDPFFGRPIAGARVAIGTDQASSNVIPPVVTGAAGTFSLGAAAGTRLVLTVTAPGYRPLVRQEVVGETGAEVEFDLSPGSVR